jgi:hypothetical protein
MLHVWVRTEMHTGFRWVNLKQIHRLEDLVLDRANAWLVGTRYCTFGFYKI